MKGLSADTGFDRRLFYLGFTERTHITSIFRSFLLHWSEFPDGEKVPMFCVNIF